MSSIDDDMPVVSRRTLDRLALAADPRVLMVEEVTIPPGASAPLHRHPVPGIVYIFEGEVESAYGDEAPRLYTAGDTLRDRTDVPHTLFRNCHADRPLRFLAIYAIVPEEAYSIRI